MQVALKVSPGPGANKKSKLTLHAQQLPEGPAAWCQGARGAPDMQRSFVDIAHTSSRTHIAIMERTATNASSNRK